MRFRLVTIFIAISLLAMFLGMYVHYGFFWGSLFLAPHLVALGCAGFLLRRGRRFSAAVLVAGYMACWAVTWQYGGGEVRDAIHTKIVGQRYVSGDLIEFRRLDYDPCRVDRILEEKTPWYFVDTAFSPCPFIVAIDYSWMRGKTDGDGYGETEFSLWFFGYQRRLGRVWQWFS